MKKFAFLIALSLFAGSTFAGITSDWSESWTENIGSGTGTVTTSLSYSDGSNFTYENAGNFYGSDKSYKFLLETNKAVDLDITINGENYYGFFCIKNENNVIIWDGDCSNDHNKDSVIDESAWWDISRSYTIMFDGTNLFINNTKYCVNNSSFDIIVQYNKIGDNAAKAAIGLELNFAEPAAPEPAPTVPAPGAVILAGFGTAIVGRVHRRMN